MSTKIPLQPGGMLKGFLTQHHCSEPHITAPIQLHQLKPGNACCMQQVLAGLLRHPVVAYHWLNHHSTE
jgi:hypothetical protein